MVRAKVYRPNQKQPEAEKPKKKSRKKKDDE